MDKEADIKKTIENIISNTCSRPGFDEFTRSANLIMDYLKANGLLATKLKGECKYEETQTLKNCLDYCRHRLKKHQNTGLYKAGCRLEFVEELERKFFHKQPDIKPQLSVEEKEKTKLGKTVFENITRSEQLYLIYKAINERVKG